LNEATNNWETFLGQLSNPGFYNMLLSMGMQLLQPMPIGQTAAGHVGTAMQGTMQNQLALLQNKLAREAATRKETREETALGYEGQKVEQGAREVGIKESAQRTADTVAQAGIMGGAETRGLKREELGLKREELGQQKSLTQAEIDLKKAQTKKAEAEAEGERAAIELGVPGGAMTSARVQFMNYVVPALKAIGMSDSQARLEAAKLERGDTTREEMINKALPDLMKQMAVFGDSPENRQKLKDNFVQAIDLGMEQLLRYKVEQVIPAGDIDIMAQQNGVSREDMIRYIAQQKGIR